VSFVTLYFGRLTYLVVLTFILAQPEDDENPEGDAAGEDVVITSHDALGETSTRGASTAGMTGNDAEAEVHASKIPKRVEIPHQSEV
jgi:hypothetical protein